MSNLWSTVAGQRSRKRLYAKRSGLGWPGAFRVRIIVRSTVCEIIICTQTDTLYRHNLTQSLSNQTRHSWHFGDALLLG